MYRFAEIVLFFGVMTFCACTDTVESDPQQISIARLKSLYGGVPTRLIENRVVVATVISSDQYRNFCNELYLEDSTGGIAVRIEGSALYRRFDVGREVSFLCGGLWLGSYGGEVRLGGEPSGDAECSIIVFDDALRRINLTGAAAEPKPVPITIGELSPRLIGCRVRLCDVAFTEGGVAWYDEKTGGVRHLADSAADTIEVRTRQQSLFAKVLLPEGRGTIVGLVGYFAGRYSLRVNNDFDNVFE
ncbi:MAG: DUF5689 domain-containing protein [Tidjanibacter sp.]|nr:DUF5689 domain-containing protein [Tidjanibacter sp.]